MSNFELTVEYVKYLYHKQKYLTNKPDYLLLRKFIKHKTCSAYQCTKFLNEDYKKVGRSITYKNVHKKVKVLLKSGLIEKTEVSKSNSINHGAIHYQLSSFGIYIVNRNFNEKPARFRPNWSPEFIDYLDYDELNLLQGYKTDPLFELFLYPNISMTTLLKLKTRDIYSPIIQYLHAVCIDIDFFLKDFEKFERNGGVYSNVYFTTNLMDPNEKCKRGGLCSFLEDLGIGRIIGTDTERIKMVSINDQLFKIYFGKTFLTLQIFSGEGRALIVRNDKIFLELECTKEKTAYGLRCLISKSFETYVYTSISSIFEEASRQVRLKLCLGLTDMYTYASAFINDDLIVDIKSIARDPQFSRILRFTKEQLDRDYQDLLELNRLSR